MLIAVSATNSLLGAKLLKKGALKRRIFQFLSAIIINATQVEHFILFSYDDDDYDIIEQMKMPMLLLLDCLIFSQV